jgi:plastocyanin
MRAAAIAIAVALLAVAAPPALARRSTARLVAVTVPPPEHRASPGLKTYVFRFGPYRIGPYQVVRGKDDVSPPPVRGAVVAMDARVVTRAGAIVPQWQLMLHHIVFGDGGPHGARRDGACPQRPGFERFFGTSEELRPMTLPPGYAYRYDRRDRWRAVWMLMNHTSRDRAAVIEYRVTVDPARTITPVKPYWLSVLSCAHGADPQYSVAGGGAPGSVDDRARVWTLPAGGRIVAFGGHLHGGGEALTVSEPQCAGRTIFRAQPLYAPADDPLYAVRPLLHEPDPKNVSWLQSATGWPVARGTRLRVTATYDAQRPHMRVMGIAHVYVARGRRPPASPCGPPPADAETLGAPFAGRTPAPAVDLTLATLGPGGIADPIARPPGAVRSVAGDARVDVRSFAFSAPNLSIARGHTITWRFRGPTPHDATLASGPQGFGSPQTDGGSTWSFRFSRAGEYRIYCSLHPVYMSQYVLVR